MRVVRKLQLTDAKSRQRRYAYFFHGLECNERGTELRLAFADLADLLLGLSHVATLFGERTALVLSQPRSEPDPLSIGSS
jgi:hypothetical protein